MQVEDVETIIFGSRFDPTRTHGRSRNKPKRTLGADEGENEDMDYGNIRQKENVEQQTTDNDSATDGTASGPTTDDEAYMSENSASGGVSLTLPDRSQPADQGHTAKQDEVKDFAAKDFGAGKVRPSQLETELNFSAMGGERGWAEKLEETDEMREKRLAGERRAREREQVRCAARRLVAFGWTVPVDDDVDDVAPKTTKKKNKKGKRGTDDDEEEVEKEEKGQKTLQKKCEAIMAGVAVEASYAKGPFAIRWREYKSGPLATV